MVPTWNFLYKKMPLTEFSTVPATCCPPVPGLGYLCMPTAVGWDCCTYTQPQDRIPAQIYSDVLPIFCVQTHGMIKAGSSLWVFSNSQLLKMKTYIIGCFPMILFYLLAGRVAVSPLQFASCRDPFVPYREHSPGFLGVIPGGEVSV